MELSASWSSGRCPCSWQGSWNQMIFKVPSNPYHSMVPLLQIGSKIIRGKSLNETEHILFEWNTAESLCPVVAITAMFLWGWWKPKGHFPTPHIQSTVFQSELHAYRPACFFWWDRGWVFTAHELKQNRSIPVSFVFSQLSCSEMNLMVMGCWKGWAHLFPSPRLQMLLLLSGSTVFPTQWWTTSGNSLPAESLSFPSAHTKKNFLLL